MDETKRIVKNTGVLLIGRVLNSILSYFLVIAIARYLGDVGLGKYSFAFAFIGIVMVFFDLGITTSAVKDLSRDKSRTKYYLHNLFSLRLVLSILSLVAAFIVINLLNDDPSIILIVSLAALAMFFESMCLTFKVVFRAHEIMEYDAISKFVERLLALVIGYYVLVTYQNITYFIVVLVGSFSVMFLINYLVSLYLFERPKLVWNPTFWKKLVVKSLPYWFTMLFKTIYFKVDTVMLSFLIGYSVTGWYNAGYMIIDALAFIPTIVIIAVFPAMARYYKESKEKLLSTYIIVFRYLFVIALAIGVGITVLSPRIIQFVYGEGFANSAIALQILIWANLFLFVNLVSGYLLNSIDEQKWFTIAAFVGVVANIILNLILIPTYSYKGAAFATLITEILIFVVLQHKARDSGYSINFSKLLIKPLIAVGLMGGIVYFLFQLHLIILVAIGALTYLSALLILGWFQENEFIIVKNLLKR